MSTEPSQTATANRLRIFIERIERLQEERKTMADDIAEVFKELEGEGFDKIAVKAAVKIRAADDGLAKWQERSAILDTYLAALGMLPQIEARAPAHSARVENVTQIRPIQAPKALPEAVAKSTAHIVTPAPEKSLAQEPSEAEGSGEAQDRCESASPPIPEQFELPAFLKRDHHVLRPHCLNPGMCAGVGRDHCWACKKALGETDEPEAAA